MLLEAGFASGHGFSRGSSASGGQSRGMCRKFFSVRARLQPRKLRFGRPIAGYVPKILRRQGTASAAEAPLRAANRGVCAENSSASGHGFSRGSSASGGQSRGMCRKFFGVRARLQPCRHESSITAASAAEGGDIFTCVHASRKTFVGRGFSHDIKRTGNGTALAAEAPAPNRPAKILSRNIRCASAP
jgi:hypothetical protein